MIIFVTACQHKNSPIYRKNDRKVQLITVRSTTLDEFYCDFLYVNLALDHELTKTKKDYQGRQSFEEYQGYQGYQG